MLYVAAAILVILGLAHSWLGERYILMRLFRRGELPKVLGGTEFTKGTLRFVWHLTTVLGLAFAAILVQVANGGSGPAVVTTLGWTSLVAGLFPLYFTRGKHLSWIGFFIAGAACLWWTGV
jgi:hypothetical protein